MKPAEKPSLKQQNENMSVILFYQNIYLIIDYKSTKLFRLLGVWFICKRYCILCPKITNKRLNQSKELWRRDSPCIRLFKCGNILYIYWKSMIPFMWPSFCTTNETLKYTNLLKYIEFSLKMKSTNMFKTYPIIGC